MGIQEELGLSKELADEIGKELKKMHQDFVKEKYTDIDGAEKWKISVTSGNKSLVENLKKKLEAKLQDKGQSIDEQIQKAREKAAERNKATQRKMPTPEKHKEQDGMSL
jgi:hypothetical protein